MRLPNNNYELTEIFKNARTPELSEFTGEYLVDMLAVLPSLAKFSHRKVFYAKDNRVSGHNVIFTKKVWGHFFLEEGICKELDSLGVVVINYDRRENPFIFSKIIDYVRRIEGNTLYIGRFNYLFTGKPRFLGYFSLSRLK